MVVSSLFRKGLKTGVKVGKGVGKVALKKGKKIAVKTGKEVGKAALRHAGKTIDTSIRGAGVAASVSAGNPIPILAAEGIIMGKDYIAKQGAKKLFGKEKKNQRGLPLRSVAKAHQYYPKNRLTKPTPRLMKNLGVAAQSHAYDAFSRRKAGKVNTASTAGRNLDFYSSAGRPTGAKL